MAGIRIRSGVTRLRARNRTHFPTTLNKRDSLPPAENDDCTHSISQAPGSPAAAAAGSVGAEVWCSDLGLQECLPPFLLEDFSQATYFLLPLSLYLLIWKMGIIISLYKNEKLMCYKRE